MKYLLFVFLISSAYAIEVEVLVDGVKVDPKQVELEIGDHLSVTAESFDSNKRPTLISINAHYAEQSFGQHLKDAWSKYYPSPLSKDFSVSKRNAIDGNLMIFINSSNGNGIGKHPFSDSDEQISIDLKVSKEAVEQDESPAQITKLVVTKDGKVIVPDSTLLKIGDEIEVYLEAISTDGSIVRGYLVVDGTSEPVFQKLWQYKTLFISDQVPIRKKFKVTRDNALNGKIVIHAVVNDGDLKKVNNLYSDDTRLVVIPVEKLEFVADQNPAKIQKVSVTIQKKNGNVIDASAKPQVYDGGMGKGSPSAPGKKASPGAAGAKAQ